MHLYIYKLQTRDVNKWQLHELKHEDVLKPIKERINEGKENKEKENVQAHGEKLNRLH
jgi:hypothetical protein